MGRLLIVNEKQMRDDLLKVVDENRKFPSGIMLSPETIDYLIELQSDGEVLYFDDEFEYFGGLKVHVADRFPFGKYEFLA